MPHRFQGGYCHSIQPPVSFDRAYEGRALGSNATMYKKKKNALKKHKKRMARLKTKRKAMKTKGASR